MSSPEIADKHSSRPGPAERWRARPVLAVSVRGGVLILPIAAGLGVAVLLGHVLPLPDGWVQTLLWWALLVSGTLVAVVLADHLCRRALPLAALLNLSLLFPDRAPSRFRVWRRRGSLVRLREELDHIAHDPAARTTQEILSLVAALAAHDPWTRGHSERVRILTDMLAEEMRLPQWDHDRLRWAALLHDIGKLDVPRALLHKPAAPDEVEWMALRRHPESGYRLLSPISDWLWPWADSVAQHHEHYDGSGYPRGLRGREICLGARIIAVADAFEAMTGRRPYHRPVDPVTARSELVRGAGSQFDPEVCRAFLRLSMGRLWRLAGPWWLAAQLPLLGWLRPVARRPEHAAPAAAAAVAAVLAVTSGLVPRVGPSAAAPGAPLSGVAGLQQTLTPSASPAPGVVGGESPAPSPGPSVDGTLGILPPALLSPTPAPTSGSSGSPTPTGAPGATPSPAPTPPPVQLAPSISIAAYAHVHAGEDYTATGSLSKANRGGLTATVDYGDGSGRMPLLLIGTEFVLNHVYASKGRFDLVVTVFGADGSRSSATTTVLVDNG